MEKFQVTSVKWKTLLLLFACLGFVTFGAILLYHGIMEWPNEIFAIIFGFITVAFFGAAFPLGVKRLFANTVELEMTKYSLNIQPNSEKGFSIPWENISQFEKISISGAKLILIHVKDPHLWIKRQNNPIKRKLMQFNLSKYGTPFNTTSSGMNISNKKLLKKLKEYHIQFLKVNKTKKD